MRVVIGSDHAGFDQKERIKAHLAEEGYELTDVGTANAEDSVDYPDFAIAASRLVASGKAGLGVLVCGTGIGMSIAANKVRGVRAALCNDLYTARMARQHNNANVLSIGARIVAPELAEEITRIFLDTQFEGGRHQRRIDEIAKIETQS